MGGGSCASCGARSSIEVDPARGDAVCTICGEVLESSCIVSDVAFEENAHGGATAIGQFVSADTKGGGLQGQGGQSGKGGKGSVAFGRESREITLRNAKNKIRALGQQLSLRSDRIEMAFNFFRMSLSRNLTRGRKSSHVIAACVYITCRTESTAHMLIDLADVLNIDAYELGRTYLKLSNELCINIPAIDPCLYVMRFANKLELGDRTHEVAMTALRLVARMKKDWMHLGRRPSGLCGAALLIASRLHNFSRSVHDVIQIVKVHESTLRKRLNEFGETPASQLTLDEFMTIDLDAMTEEMDPPSYRANRKKDRERLTLLEEENADLEQTFAKLEGEIDRQLELKRAKMMKRGPYAKAARLESCTNETTESGNDEVSETEKFIAMETMETISALVNEDDESQVTNEDSVKYHKSPMGLGLKATIDEYILKKSGETEGSSSKASSSAGVNNSEKGNDTENEEDSDEACELDLNGIDDDEIDSYIMTTAEIKQKTNLWMRVNAEYLKVKAEKEEKARLEMEEAIKEGRNVKTKSKTRAKRGKGNKDLSKQHHDTALEAIEKMVAEKKISTKINYDVLKTLNTAFSPAPQIANSPRQTEGTERGAESEAELLSPPSQPPEEDVCHESAAQLLSQHRGDEETNEEEFDMF